MVLRTYAMCWEKLKVTCGVFDLTRMYCNHSPTNGFKLFHGTTVMWQEMQKCERKDGVEDRKLVNMDVNNAGFKIVFKNLIF